MWNDLPERASGWTIKKTLWTTAGVLLAAAIIIPILGLGFGWFNSTLQVVSPQNVREQYSTAYGDWEGMKGTANNVCAFRTVVAEAPADVRDQRITALIAYQQNYTRLAADYDAAYDNAFRAKHVGPTDIPNKAPSLADMLQQLGCTTPDPLAAK